VYKQPEAIPQHYRSKAYKTTFHSFPVNPTVKIFIIIIIIIIVVVVVKKYVLYFEKCKKIGPTIINKNRSHLRSYIIIPQVPSWPYIFEEEVDIV